MMIPLEKVIEILERIDRRNYSSIRVFARAVIEELKAYAVSSADRAGDTGS